jgi:hypothetical protein
MSTLAQAICVTSGHSIPGLPAYSRGFSEDNFQSSMRIAYYRIHVLPLKMRCFQGFQQILAGFYPEVMLFSLFLQQNASMMTHFSHSAAVKQLPAAKIDPSWQVNLGFWGRAGGDNSQNYCWRSSQW